ncbi:MAG: phage tail tip lysozyme, partial [Solirubrobacterales bacterium]
VQSAAIDELQGRVNELGRSRATISINTRGVAESLAEVELLHRRLNELDRQRSTPSVGLGAGSLGRSVVGGGGGGGRGGGLNIPFAGSIPYPIVAAGLGAAPPLLGGATALLGSAGAATLGAGAIGSAGLGVLAAGIGSIATVAIPAVKGLKESYKALTAYNKAVATNGKESTQAHTALEKLNAALKSAPGGTRGVLNREQALTSRFGNLTKPGQESFMGTLSNLLGAGNQLAPQLSGIANGVLGGVQNQSGRLSNFLTGGTTRGFLGSAGATAISVLPDVESTFQHVMATLMNISRASMPFFRQSISWLEEWTGGWASSTGNIDSTREKIGGLVDQLKSWGRLGGAGFDLIRDLLKPSAGSGQSMVDDLTRQLDKWDSWIKRNPAKVKSFFSEAVEGTEKIASAIGNITTLIFKVGRMLTPLLTQASQFVTFFSESGLLGPSQLPLLLAGGAGIRNTIKGARGRILGGPGATATAGVSAEEAAVLGAGTLGGAGAARTAARAGLFTRGRGFLGSLGSAYRSAGRVPIAGAGGTLAAEADAGMIGETAFSRSAGLRGAGRLFASDAIPSIAGAGGSFIRGAGARYLPIAALMGGLSAASFKGNIYERGQAALSSITAGIYPGPKSGAEKEDEATRHAQMVANYYAEKYGGGPKGLGEQIMATRRKRNRILQPEGPGTPNASGLLEHGLAHYLSSPSVSDESRKEAEALGKQLEQLRAIRQEEAGRRRDQKRAEREQRGVSRGAQYAKSFQIRAGKEGGVAALEDMSGPILKNIEHLGPAGGKALAASVLQWTRTAKQQNPKLKKQYEELVEGITHNFAKMGERIKIINGEIYEGSSREWMAIQKSMANPIEQAREEMSRSFTAIQREAEHVLRAMGYSPSQAKNLVQSEEQGHPTKALAAEGAAAHHHGTAGASPNNIAPQPKGARGMRIPGYGNTDHVPIGGATGIGAPDELIVNQHTERTADRLLGMFGTTLEALQRSETKPQSSPIAGNTRMRDQLGGLPGFARGGRQRGGKAGGVGGGLSWRGISPSGVHPGARKVAEAIMGHFGGLQATSTIGGTHASGSYHYLGEAVDIAGSTPEMYAAAQWIEKSGLYRQLTEGIHNPNLSVSDGKNVPSSYYSSVWAEHANHIHVAVAHEVGRLLGLGGGGASMAGGGGGARSIHLKGRHSKLGGVPGAAANAGMGSYARGLEQHINKRLGRMGGGGAVSVPTSGGPVIAQIGRGLLRGGLNKIGAAGIIGNALQESGWDPSSIGSGGGGLWGFTSSPYSLADLQSYASQQNRRWNDASLQTQFLLKFLSGSLKSKLNAASSPGEAAAIFMNEWERPAVATENQARREQGARQAFAAGYNRGGRLPNFAGWFAKGGAFTTRGATLFGAGEGNVGEDVQIRPHGRPNRLAKVKLGGGGHKVSVELKGPFHVREDADIEKIADAVGKKLVAALNESDKVDQKEVIG